MEQMERDAKERHEAGIRKAAHAEGVREGQRQAVDRELLRKVAKAMRYAAGCRIGHTADAQAVWDLDVDRIVDRVLVTHTQPAPESVTAESCTGSDMFCRCAVHTKLRGMTVSAETAAPAESEYQRGVREGLGIALNLCEANKWARDAADEIRLEIHARSQDAAAQDE
jgi:hypothetical protein